MLRILCLALVVALAPASAQQRTLFSGESGDALLASARATFKPSTGQIRSSAQTKDLMMFPIWTVDEGAGIGVRGAYTGWFVPFDNDPPGNANQEVFNNGSGLNQEHVWPRSRLGGAEVSERDLHHLFPTRVAVNSDRASLPFDEVPDAAATDWYIEDTRTGAPPTTDRDAYSERQSGVAFEPRESVKGDVARAMFYVAAMYPDEADLGWFAGQRETLYDWHYADPADAAEFDRTVEIAGYQGGADRENPFVLDSTLVRRAFFPERSTASGPAPVAGALDVLGATPFVSEVRLRLTLPAAAPVRAEAFDVLGRRVAVLFDGVADRAVLRLDGTALAPGVYVVRVVTGGGVLTRRLVRAR